MARQAASGKRTVVVTALPVAPVDGQEVIWRFVPVTTPATTVPLLWHLRWDAAISAWLPVGEQRPVYAAYAPGAAVSMGANAWGTYDANDPRVTAPRAGVYEIEGGVGECYGTMQGFYISAGINTVVNTTLTGEASTAGATTYSPQIGGSMQMRTPETTLALNDLIRQFYYLWSTGPQNIVMRDRYIQIKPLRIT